jgi:hypothetical protein
MRVSVALFVLMMTTVLVSSASSSEYLKEVDAKEFDKNVVGSSHVWLIHFSSKYHIDLESDSAVLSELRKAAEALNGVFSVGYVNAAEAKS